MTKWSAADRRSRIADQELKQTHVIWRGIGCLLMLIIPIISYILAMFTVSAGLDAGWPMPYQLLGNPVMPAALWNLGILDPLLGLIQSQANLYAILAVAVLYIVFFSALIAFLYAVLYRLVGPSRYGPLDAPPPRVRAQRYRR